MANKTNTQKNFFETVLDAQQQAVDTLVENTKKYTNGNAIINETLDKSTDFYKKTVDTATNTAKTVFEKVNGQADTLKQETNNTSEKMNEYFQNWYKQQTNWANQMMEMNKNLMSGMGNMGNMQNPMQNMMNMWNQMNGQNPWSAMMGQLNMGNMQDQMNKATEQYKAFWAQFQNILNTNYSELSKNFQNGTLADTYKGMFNMTDGFSKFYEMWMPMMKSMQEKTFNMDMFKANLDMSKYKEFLDKYFTFMPQGTQEYFNKMKDMYAESMKNGGTQMNEMFNNMKSSMHNMMPEMFGNPFSGMLNQYNNMYSQMMNAVSPFAKLMTPSQDTKTMQEWNQIINQMNVYNLKSAEMQYMVYQQGMKVMENIAENMMHKIENGENVDSMMKLYQEWLNASDAKFVELFETDEYSQLMAEVSALQLRIKKSVEGQMEKMFVNVPLATRSEMDEVYQTIYDLKKQVRQLQSMLELEDEAPKATATKKSATRKK
ncbi:MAG: hypothetical protein KBF25_08010 [Chitinophagaceae bacterium]|nr:hypothetical protein [Chitinophagaceae bacterium]